MWGYMKDLSVLYDQAILHIATEIRRKQTQPVPSRVHGERFATITPFVQAEVVLEKTIVDALATWVPVPVYMNFEENEPYTERQKRAANKAANRALFEEFRDELVELFTAEGVRTVLAYELVAAFLTHPEQVKEFLNARATTVAVPMP